MKLKSCYLILFIISFFIACGGSSNSVNDADGELSGAEFRAITNTAEILAGIESDGASGTLILVNNSNSSIESPTLSFYDLESGEATDVETSSSSLAAGESETYEIDFPDNSAPEDTDLIGLSLGDDEAAIFMTSSAYSELSPAITDPDISASFSTALVPLSGTWNFEMDLATSYLSGSNCPSEALSLTSSGSSSLYVSPNGNTASWIIETNGLSLSRTPFQNTYTTPTYTFEVETEDESIAFGTNYWELTPSSSTAMSGTLEWDNNQGCSASYPVTMTRQATASPLIFELCEGMWSINYSISTCGGSPVVPEALGAMPSGSGILEIVNNPITDEPMHLSFDTLSGYQILPRIGNTNIYGTGISNMSLGYTYDVFANPINLIGGYQMTAISESMIVGTVNIQGFGIIPCNGIAIFTMESLSGC